MFQELVITFCALFIPGLVMISFIIGRHVLTVQFKRWKRNYEILIKQEKLIAAYEKERGLYLL